MPNKNIPRTSIGGNNTIWGLPMHIKRLADSLAAKFHTRDPFELASQVDILLLLEPLGSVRGYYSFCYRQKIIHINQALSYREQRFVCAHELGHALLHPELNVLFLRTNTLFSTSRLEHEANLFAASLLFEDSVFLPLRTFSTAEIAQTLGIPAATAADRMRLLCVCTDACFRATES